MNFDIWHIAIPVRDLKRSVRFYCEGLGFKLIGHHIEGSRHQAFVKIESKPFTIELFQPTENIEETLKSRPHHLAFECEDLDVVRADFVRRGLASDLKPVAAFENGVRYLAVKDPDGIPLEFFQGRDIFDNSIVNHMAKAVHR